jgi:hypothetical protein
MQAGQTGGSNSKPSTASGNRRSSAAADAPKGSVRAQSAPKTRAAPKDSHKDRNAANYNPVDAIRKKQNEELLMVLDQEQRREEEREMQLEAVTDPAERRRLEKIFGMERASANQRILELTALHERVLQKALREFYGQPV